MKRNHFNSLLTYLYTAIVDRTNGGRILEIYIRHNATTQKININNSKRATINKVSCITVSDSSPFSIVDRKKEWIKNNPEKIKEYRIKYEKSENGKRTKKQYAIINKNKRDKYKAEWRKKNRHKSREYYLKYKNFFPEKLKKKNFQSRILLSGIDMTFNEYEILQKKQKGYCAICLKKNKCKRELSIDHCHKTNKSRGLLCSKCNLGIGLLEDDPKIIKSALKYLNKYK